jgi:transposase
LRLLVEKRFPAVWQPSAGNEAQGQLLMHRCRLGRMRTRLKNQLDSIAKSEGLTGSRSWSSKCRQQIEALPLRVGMLSGAQIYSRCWMGWSRETGGVFHSKR